MGRNSKKQFRRNERTYKGHQNLDKFLAEKKLERKPIAKDGSCLFRAVAEQVFSSQSCHHKVRMQCVEYIQTHQDDFKEFITVSIPEYLDHLKCELWGGEVELVVLSRLYDRPIHVYNEAAGLVHEQVFQSSEDQASTQQRSPIMLAYSGGNHYDSVYSIQHMRNTAFCQGLVYKMFYCQVMRDHMPVHCQHKLTTLNETDIDQIKKVNYDRSVHLDRSTQLLVNHYKIEELEAMGAYTYRNTALYVHQLEKASIERRDRRVAASIQFQRGDAVTFKIDDKEMEGEIAGLNVSLGCHLVYVLKSREEWAIPAKDIALKQPSHPNNSGRRGSSHAQSSTRPRSQQQPSIAETSAQKVQQPAPQPTPSSDSSKPVTTKEVPTAVSKDVLSSKKPATQSAGSSSSGGVKMREGKRGSGSQQVAGPSAPGGGGGGNVPKGNPHTVVSSAAGPSERKPSNHPSSSSSVAPPTSSTTSTPDLKQPSSTSPGGTAKNVVESGYPAPRRGGALNTRNLPAQQMRSQQHGVKTVVGTSARVTRRTDAGSLDSDGPSTSSGDEEAGSPRGGGSTAQPRSSGNKLPTYYSGDCWGNREQGAAESKIPQSQQKSHPPHQKERKNQPAIVEGSKISRMNIGNVYSADVTNLKQVPLRAQKSVSTHMLKESKVSEVNKVQPSKSTNGVKVSSRHTTVAPPTMKLGDVTLHDSPDGNQQPQQSNVIQTPHPGGLLQQQSPIQGLIDGPNSGPNGGRDGRESPPYLERQIPRDPSSQPQDAWPMFEEDPGLSTITSAIPPVSVTPMMLNAASMAQRQLQQQQNQEQKQQHHHHQQQAPPTAVPPLNTTGGSGGITRPSPGGIPSPTPTMTNAVPAHNAGAIPLPPPPTMNTNFAVPVGLLSSVVSSNSILTTTPSAAQSMPPAHQPSKPVATPPQSPHSATEDKQHQVVGSGGTAALLSSVKPQTTTQQLPQQGHQQQPHHQQQPQVLGFRQPISPTSTSAVHPAVYQSLIQSHPFMASMTPISTAAMQQFYRNTMPHRASGMEMLYNQAQGHHHHPSPPPPPLPSSSVPGELSSDKPSVAGVTPLVPPLQPLSTSKKKPSSSSSYGERTAPMSPLLVTAYTQTEGPKMSNTMVQTVKKRIHSRSCQATPALSSKETQTEDEYVLVEDLRPPLLESDTKAAKLKLAIQYSIQCLNMYLQYCNDDETAAETLGMLEELEEQGVKEPSMTYESQLTALNASQTNFLASLGREKSPFFPSLPQTITEGLQQLKQVKETTPPQPPAEPEHTTSKQQAATTLADSSSSSSEPHPPAHDDEKASGSLNVNVTPQQEAQAQASTVTPIPVAPMMMHPQRPAPYMVPMPMFYNPTAGGFYHPSFPGMPGMPSMMMSPYGHPMIPQAQGQSLMQQHQQQQQQNQQQQQLNQPSSQQEQNQESHEDTQPSIGASAGIISTPLPPTQQHPPPSIPSPPPPPPPSTKGTTSTSVDFEPTDNSTALVGVQNIPSLMDNVVDGDDPSAVQVDDRTLEDDQPHTVENTAVLPTAPLASSLLEELHRQSAEDEEKGEEDDGQAELMLVNYAAVDPDVNVSNPGLPCRGTSVNSKDMNFFDEQQDDQKTDITRQYRRSRSKQQNMLRSSRAGSGSHYRQQQQKSGSGSQSGSGTGTGFGAGTGTGTSTKSASSYNQGEASFRKRYNPRNQRQQQFTNISGRRYQNSGRSYTNGGRFQRFANSHGQCAVRSSSGTTSSSTTVGAGQDQKSVTPVPATNNSVHNDSGDRNVLQYNKFSASGGDKFSPKSFTSFPASPHNHTSNNIMGNIMGNIMVPQMASDSNEESTKNEHRWQFKDSATEGQRLEIPDPNLLKWSSGAQLVEVNQYEYAETVEDPFLTVNPLGEDKEFQLNDIDDIDQKYLYFEKFFPALCTTQIPGRYDQSDVHHHPAQCTHQNDAPKWMRAGNSSHPRL